MHPFTLLIKPASADCNLRCDYCFYLEKIQLYPDTTIHRMADRVLARLIRGYMETDQPYYGFGWQGGEPALMGTEFFRRVTQLQAHYGRSGAQVANGLQTNATLITDEMARHFSQYRFLLGCSLDGPAEIHDRYRLTRKGNPSHHRVLEGLNALKRHHVEFNILTLVSQANVSSPGQVYRYLVDQGFLFHQYIPCVEFDNRGEPMPFAISGKEWGEFLCELFDEWYLQDTHRVSIRLFDGILHRMIHNPPTICHMDRNCRQYLLIEHNGDVYPCDFFVKAPLKLGNIMENSLPELFQSSLFKEFGAQKAQWNKSCRSCNFLNLCQGDCLKHRVYHENSPRNQSWLCEGWKQFFEYSQKRFQHLVDEIPNSAIRQSPSERKTIRRNDPCPCGSGRKYKKCCGA
jgi:uncharacterized protein